MQGQAYTLCGSFLEELLAELKKLNDDPKVAR